jgi:hypothetical protein
MNYPAHEVQFHMYRLGRRNRVAQLYVKNKDTFREFYPTTDIDKYMNGQIISIGGLLARMCVACGTAREIERFVSKATNSSGCGNTCDSCRTTQRRTEKLHAQYLTVRSKL